MIIMKNVYPVIFTKGEDAIIAYVPDFDINTQGSDLADAMYMARDAIGLMGIDMQDDGEELPKQSDYSAIVPKEGETVALIDIDFAEYRRAQDLKTVRKNVSLPSWLNNEAEKAGINFSAILQNALKNELHIQR